MTQNPPNWPDFSNCCPICNNHVDVNYTSYNVSNVNHYEYHKVLERLMSSTKITKEYLENFSMGCMIPTKICEKCKLSENICLCKKIIIKKGRSVGASTDLVSWYLLNNKLDNFHTGHQFPELMKLPGGQSWSELMLSNKKN